MRVHGRANVPDQRVALPDRFVVVQQGLRGFELELHQALGAPGRLLAQQRLTADEAAGFVPLDRESEARLQRRVLVGDVMAPVPVGLLDAQGVERVVARMHEPEARPRRRQFVVHALHELGGHVRSPIPARRRR